ncbi:hypothetical protein HCZ23_07875 [Celeribacter sp. HF31]|uniref:hypothetical protein n=1 Tax=Celeribacter sp. HF31 TaxID=2721558 RepID=UPI0014300F2A|nr:hypothetical protein [Celeribacter sp. HF31]NIY79387.1 hypothetical protein [Celeribacter sp. HF31]
MTGFILFQNAVLRVFRHLDEALAVSGLIWIGILIIQILTYNFIDMEILRSLGIAYLSSQDRILLFLSNLVIALGSCWIAVEWHIFALRSERPTSAFPKLRGGQTVSYLLLTMGLILLIGLVISLFFVVLFSILGTGFAQSFGMLFLIVVMALPATFLFLRLSPVLPSVALGEKLPLRAAWNATQPHSALLLQAAVLLIVFFIFIQAVVLLFGAGILGLLVELVVGWFFLMINVSLLSSIYELAMKGHLND